MLVYHRLHLILFIVFLNFRKCVFEIGFFNGGQSEITLCFSIKRRCGYTREGPLPGYLCSLIHNRSQSEIRVKCYKSLSGYQGAFLFLIRKKVFSQGQVKRRCENCRQCCFENFSEIFTSHIALTLFKFLDTLCVYYTDFS